MLERGGIVDLDLPFCSSSLMRLAFMRPSTGSSHAHSLTGHKFFLLFLFLLAVLVLYPYMQNGGFGYFAFRIISSAGILVAVYAIRLRRTLLLVALLLAVPALLERMLLRRSEAGLFPVLSVVLSFVFDVFVVVVMFRRVFTTDDPNSETIFGALCIYLLIGFSFANLYGLVAMIQPKAFYLDPLTNLHTVPDRFDFIYYSFATMTSLGAVGFTAVSAQARSLSVIEAIIGVLYLAVLITRLMSAYRYRPASGD